MSNSRPTTPVKKSVPPMVAIQLDMSAPTPQPSPRQFAFDVSLLSPQPDDGPTPTFFQHPILATSPPSSPTTAHYAPRPNTAPPAISTFSDVERDDLARPQTAQHQQFQPRRPPATARRASDKFIAPGGELLPPPPPLCESVARSHHLLSSDLIARSPADHFLEEQPSLGRHWHILLARLARHPPRHLYRGRPRARPARRRPLRLRSRVAHRPPRPSAGLCPHDQRLARVADRFD